MATIESPQYLATQFDVVSVSSEAGGVVVWLHGEHDISTVTELSDALARAIASGEGDLVVDLSMSTFIGAATLGVIVRAQQFLRMHSRSLRLRSPSRSAQRLLSVCGLTGLVDAAPST